MGFSLDFRDKCAYIFIDLVCICLCIYIYSYFIINPYYLLSIKNCSQTQEFGFVQKSFDHKWYYMCSDWWNAWQKKSSLATLWSPYCLLKDRAWSYFLLRPQNCFFMSNLWGFCKSFLSLTRELSFGLWGKKSIMCVKCCSGIHEKPLSSYFYPFIWNYGMN